MTLSHALFCFNQADVSISEKLYDKVLRAEALEDQYIN